MDPLAGKSGNQHLQESFRLRVPKPDEFRSAVYAKNGGRDLHDIF